MKMSNLDDTFDIESTIVPSEKVGITPEQKPDRLTKSDIDKDYEYTRGNLYSIIEKGQEALMVFLNLHKIVRCLEHMKLLVS